MKDWMVGADSSPQGSPLAHRLAAARRYRFVGRGSEKELFRTLLLAAKPPFVLLHLYGPGGIGKTTLLSEFFELSLAADATPIRLDARDLEPSPQGFLAALCLALGLEPDASPLEALSQRGARSVLLLDTYEQLSPLDGWLREHFLPQVPEGTLVVLAGRQPPSEAWRSDPGWRELMRVMSLRNLRPEESRDFLRRHGVREEQHGAALAFTHGHPLALSLVADVLEQTGGPFEPGAAPDVIRALLARFLSEVPSPEHREALEIFAHVRVTSESLLREALTAGDAHALFAWLRGLSFVQHGPGGLFPHDLARDAIDLDARWRDPDTYAALHRRVRAYYLRKLDEADPRTQQRVFLDIAYLHRNSPIMGPYFAFEGLSSVYAERAQEADHPAILAMTEAHLGADTAQLAGYWLARQPEAFVVVRGAVSEVVAYCAQLLFLEPTPQDLHADPVVRAVWNQTLRHAPTRPGEAVSLWRFMCDRTRGCVVSPAITLLQAAGSLLWLGTPNLAWTFIALPNPAYWHAQMSYVDFRRAEGADVELGGRRWAAYAHDWRAVSPAAWLELTGDRELMSELKLGELERASPAPIIVLSHPEFAEAVRRALHDHTRPAALAANPLLRSRLVSERAGTEAAATLRALVLEAAETLRANPKDEKLYQALKATYLEPAATQELAAERLGLPFSTYRRHFTAGIARVTEWLWARELYGHEGS